MKTPLVSPGRFRCHAVRWRVLLALGAAACGDDVVVPRDRAAVSSPPAAGGARQLAVSEAATSAPVMDASAPAPPIAPNQIPNSAQPTVAAPSMVIRNGTASLEVDSLEAAIAGLQRLAVAMGGYVGNSSQATGSYNERTATLELKIPAARYDSAVINLTPIGKVESQTSTAEDVGEEFYDITARQANARRLEERLITLLATRTGKLEDVLAVERELARVREEIERYEGRLRYLKSHVATSTLTVTVHEKRAIASGYTGRNVIVESFKEAWRLFVSFISIAIASLGWIIPLGVLVLIGIGIRKRMKARKTSQ